jgi:hypothetical protein
MCSYEHVSFGLCANGTGYCTSQLVTASLTIVCEDMAGPSAKRLDATTAIPLSPNTRKETNMAESKCTVANHKNATEAWLREH